MPRTLIALVLFAGVIAYAGAQPTPAPTAPPAQPQAPPVPQSPAEQMDCSSIAPKDLEKKSADERKRIKENCDKADRKAEPKKRP